MTKREYFETIKAAVMGNDELVAFCDHEIELLSKKYSSKGETKIQKENKEICKMLKESVLSTTPMTVSEILEVPTVSQYVTVEGKVLSNQKVSRLLNDMVKAGELVKTVDKKVAYFAIV